MPEGYTHIRTAEKALIKSELIIFDRAAFCTGAQGPDPLFFYEIWKKINDHTINNYASKMHKEKTGEFLKNLVENAKTPLLKSYAMGFLTHYATDKNAHPYVKMITSNGEAFDMPNGHAFYEMSLDSQLHTMDFGSPVVKLSHSTKLPKQVDLYEISTLLHIAIDKTYGEKLEVSLLYQAFCDMRFVRRMLRSRFGIMKKVYKLAEKKIVKKDGLLLAHLTPGVQMPPMPTMWKNEFDGFKSIKGDIDDCLENAVDEGVDFLHAAQYYWEKKLTIDEFFERIGNKSYETGRDIIDIVN